MGWGLLDAFGWKKGAPGATGLARLGGLGGRAALGAGGIGALLMALGELGDPNDSTGGNLADAAGAGLGGFGAGAAVMAPALLAGGPVGLGTLALASLAAAAGSQLGKFATRGTTDMLGLTSEPDPFAKDLVRANKVRQQEIANKALEFKTLNPLMHAQAQQELLLNQKAAQMQARLTQDQNLQNAAIAHILGSSGRTQDAMNQIFGA